MTVVFAQFFCTSLWFVGNAISSDLKVVFQLGANSMGYLTASVQLGFITGTLTYAFFSFADRYNPSRVFFISSSLAAFINFGTLYPDHTVVSLSLIRFAVGFFLAGIYPVGMKIASDYFDKGLGRSLALIVGALVIGTALPHLLKSITAIFSWQSIVYTTSLLSILGGTLILILIPTGPFQKKASKFNPSQMISVFKNEKLRRAAFGYFGHMWELYAFWAFTPLFIDTYNTLHGTDLPSSFLSFFVIGIGFLGCFIAGQLSLKYTSSKIARAALLISGVCCLVSPLIYTWGTPIVLTIFLLVWGMAVVADSPLFSSLVANSTEADSKGTALTIVTSIGFGISVLSIQLLNYLQFIDASTRYLMLVLVLGPLFGLLFQWPHSLIGNSK